MGEGDLQISEAESPQVPGTNPTQGEAQVAVPIPGEHKGPVNALTVLALLEKLEEMLGKVQETQVRMENRQMNLGNSVRKVQGEMAKLGRSQNSTSNAVSKLLQGSRQVSAAVRDASLRMERRREGVDRLERIHSEILRKNQFNVLLYQEEIEVPEGLFPQIQDPAISPGEYVDDGETFHTICLSSDEEEKAQGDTGDKGEKVTGLKRAGSLKKAFTFKNIEKMMAKMGNKMVSPERREKIKKSLSSQHQKTGEVTTAQEEKEGQEEEQHESKKEEEHETKDGEAKNEEKYEAKDGEDHEAKKSEEYKEFKKGEDHETMKGDSYEMKDDMKDEEDHKADEGEATYMGHWTYTTTGGKVPPEMPYPISGTDEEDAGGRGSDGWWMVEEEEGMKETWEAHGGPYDQHQTRTPYSPNEE
uniref:Caveolae-associated protein 2-like n=1 Tax=Geotrypetes seraphini TaxID=260995 RepID=A0A6P8PY53_GEOSA|nr:caveolae-associated protein 2-like [Geotrypetes seraphini]